MLLYDPRKLATPWEQTTCVGQQPIKDLHWQHSASSKLARTAAKEQTADSQRMRHTSEASATPWPAAVADLAPSQMATPAPASRAVQVPEPNHKMYVAPSYRPVVHLPL